VRSTSIFVCSLGDGEMEDIDLPHIRSEDVILSTRAIPLHLSFNSLCAGRPPLKFLHIFILDLFNSSSHKHPLSSNDELMLPLIPRGTELFQTSMAGFPSLTPTRSSKKRVLFNIRNYEMPIAYSFHSAGVAGPKTYVLSPLPVGVKKVEVEIGV